MTGAIDIIEHRYAGIDPANDILHIDPRLPTAITQLRLRQQFRGRWYALTISPSQVEITLEPDGPGQATVSVTGRHYSIEPGSTVQIDLPSR